VHNRWQHEQDAANTGNQGRYFYFIFRRHGSFFRVQDSASETSDLSKKFSQQDVNRSNKIFQFTQVELDQVLNRPSD
jgi:hypothetical protein